MSVRFESGLCCRLTPIPGAKDDPEGRRELFEARRGLLFLSRDAFSEKGLRYVAPEVLLPHWFGVIGVACIQNAL